MSQILKDRLLERLSATGLSARQASIRAKKSESFVKNILHNPAQKPQAENISALADILECDIDYLLGRQDVPIIDKNARLLTLEVRGKLEADVWRGKDVESAVLGEVVVPYDTRYPNLERRVFEVVGDSFDQVAPSGSYAVCVALRGSGITLREGQTVVVDRSRDDGNLIEQSLKRVKKGEGSFLLAPLSSNKKYQTFDLGQIPGNETISITWLVLDIVIPLST